MVAVARIMMVQKRTYIALIGQALLGLIAVAMNMIGYHAKVDDACESSPLQWETFFLVNTITLVACIANIVLVLYATYRISNRSTVTAQVHERRGKEEQAVVDLQEGQAQAKVFLMLRPLLYCGLFPSLLFSLIWLILGFVTLTGSDGEACGKPKNWFLLTSIFNIGIYFIAMGMKPSDTQGANAATG